MGSRNKKRPWGEIVLFVSGGKSRDEGGKKRGTRQQITPCGMVREGRGIQRLVVVALESAMTSLSVAFSIKGLVQPQLLRDNSGHM